METFIYFEFGLVYMDWKEKVDPTIRTHLDKQIAESIKDRRAYEEAMNPGIAQLWIAVANLSKEIFDLNLKFKYIESSLKEFTANKSKKKKISTSKPKVEPKQL